MIPAVAFGWVPKCGSRLRHKMVKQACVVYSVDEIVRDGMPVDKVGYVALCHEEMALPAEWITVTTARASSAGSIYV